MGLQIIFFILKCLDGIKAHQKLVSLGEHIGDYPTGMDIDQVDLCRYLYKLHFQLLMFLESFSKLLRLISQSNSDITCDKSIEVALIQNELKKVFKMTNVELEAEIQKNVEQTTTGNMCETKLETTKAEDHEVLGNLLRNAKSLILLMVSNNLFQFLFPLIAINNMLNVAR